MGQAGAAVGRLVRAGVCVHARRGGGMHSLGPTPRGHAAGALIEAVATRMYYRLSIIVTTDGQERKKKEEIVQEKKRKKTQERNDKRNKRGGCWLLRVSAISRNPAVKRKKEKEKESKKVNKKERKIERDTEIKKESFALLVLQYAKLWK